MAILRCNNCSYLREVSNDHVGKAVKCPVCEKAAVIHDTVEFVKKLIDKYGVLLGKYRELEQHGNAEKETGQSGLPPAKIEDLDLHNTAVMSNSMQYKPIITWFERKDIQVGVNHEALDTQGFYDEVAVELGDNIEVLQDILDKIRKTQRNNYTSVVLNLTNTSQNQIKIITRFCKNLYDFSFVAKYFYNKNEKRVHLTLQSAPAIVSFFNGEWLEWYVFMTLLKHCYESNGLFSCLRNFNIQFANEDKYEVDVFFLLNSRTPVFIECKSGEFRPFIEKYSKMRRRLDINKENFLLLVLGLSDEQVQGLTKMYDITFANEKTFLPHITGLMATK
ncbi:hypothetical protein IVG45_19355 [Methylomonas sp. LL1]|uniref:hypothetical protein n=1 Tax=Methylomonas sp. LL1 TaxID=2785785 RepID=UPI0018C447BC|nr:hypothetical protein [Methylomonas sp. LL1]QPK62953.1 hypothetical protein IVG45_19355 [Methylomonas sp. LL1]